MDFNKYKSKEKTSMQIYKTILIPLCLVIASCGGSETSYCTDYVVKNRSDVSLEVEIEPIQSNITREQIKRDYEQLAESGEDIVVFKRCDFGSTEGKTPLSVDKAFNDVKIYDLSNDSRALIYDKVDNEDWKFEEGQTTKSVFKLVLEFN